DVVLPEPAIASPAVAGTSRGLRLPLEAEPDCTFAARFNLLRPERAFLESALAAGAAERVHVQLPQKRMADEQPGQVVGQTKTLARMAPCLRDVQAGQLFPSGCPSTSTGALPLSSTSMSFVLGNLM